MREIKFRAWDKQAKRIGQVWEIDIVNEFARYDDENKRYSSQGYDMPLILMQYTGLKDKNGKEIYEGDIITQKRADKAYSDKAKYQDVLMVVSWHDGLAYRSDESLELNPHAIDNPSWFNQSPKFIATPAGKTKFTNHAWSSFHNCEVVGNIYEHAHLLETPQAIARQHKLSEAEAVSALRGQGR